MTKKRINSLLLPLVLAVWVGVFYRIFGEQEEPPPLKYVPSSTLMLPATDSAIEASVLSLDYPDPFQVHLTKVVSRNPVPNTGKKSSKKTSNSPPPSPQAVPWPQLRYLGLAVSEDSEASLSVLQIDDQVVYVKPGEVVSGLEIQQIWPDSIAIHFQDSTQVFQLR